MRKLKLISVIPAFIVFATFASESSHHFDGKTWWRHVEVLADDKMEGRETGSEGLRRAQAYIVDQLKESGVEPKGIDGYYQPVKLISRRLLEKESSLALVREGSVHPLNIGDDALVGTRTTVSEDEITAPLVFVGYGLKIPEKNYDDLEGLDLKNKVAVIVSGSPADVPSALASHYQTVGERWKSLKAAGVIGIISIPNPASMDIPWSRIALNRNHPSMDLADEEFHETPGQKVSAFFNPAKAEQLFAGSAHTFQEIASLAKDRKPLPRFPLTPSIRVKAKIETKEVDSANVVGVYPGSDPELKNQYVVLSAHADHLGIGEPVDGDKIYNGAMDDASGCAALLDLAHSLKESKEKTRRSILFVFVTAEEKGLLGSKYFAAHPTVDSKSMVADINIDMFLPIVALKVLTVYGLAESDLGDRVTEAAKFYSVPTQADPQPLRNIFIRSDQYNFVRHGVPSVMIDVGTVPGTAEDNVKLDWLHHRYHAPSDDLKQPVDLGTAAIYEDIVRNLIISVANDPKRPQWKLDSFFRRYE